MKADYAIRRTCKDDNHCSKVHVGQNMPGEMLRQKQGSKGVTISYNKKKKTALFLNSCTDYLLIFWHINYHPSDL